MSTTAKYFAPGGTRLNSLRCRQTINYVTNNKSDYICESLENRINKDKPGYVKTSISTAMRQSNILSSAYLGGTVQFGNGNAQYIINELGGTHGQPGGLPRPLRNKF